MLRKSDNIFRAIVAEGTGLLSAIPAEGAIVTDANLPKGATVITDLGLKRITEAELVAMAGDDKFIIVQGKGAGKQLMKTAAITKSTITISKQKFLPAAQQVTAIGYNGTTGTLPAANSTDYWIRIKRNDNNGRDNSQGTSMFAGPIKSSAAATQAEVAFALAENGVKENSDEPDSYVSFEVLSDMAEAAPTGTHTHLLFTKGSKTVRCCNSSGVLNTGSETVLINGSAAIAGQFISTAAGSTVAHYKIKSSTLTAGSATTIVLTTPYVGATVIVAKADLEVSTIAQGAAAACGVRITGVENAFSVSNWRNYYVNRFTANLFGGTALVTSVTGANTGSGVWQQVAMDEFMTYGFEGQGTIGTPPTTRDAEVVENAKYSIVEISWKEDVSFLTSNGTAVGSVLFYAGLNAAGTLLSSGGTATAAGKVADMLGAIAVPTFASTDLNA